MLTFQVQDSHLEEELTAVLNQRFNGNWEEMLQDFLRLYNAQQKRLKYSGILKWDKDGVAFQKDVRSEWQ